MTDKGEYIGELGLILLTIILTIIIAPVIIAIGITLLIGLTGAFFYTSTILISTLIWAALYFLWWI